MEERQAVNSCLPCLPSTPSSHLPLLQKYQRVLHTLIPSQGDLPPPKDFFPITPVPPPVESFHPTAEEISLDPESHLDLPESMPLVARWNSLVSPPDNVATNIAIEGLKLKFHTAPPLCPRDFPPPSAFTSDNQIVPLTPFVEDWLKRGILTKTGIPQAVFFSRMFHVPKKPDKIRPIIDLSRLNTFIATPSLKMEHLGKILPLISQQMWGTSLDITDAFLSVLINVEFQKYFCFILNGTIYMFLKMPFGLTTAPWAFSRLMRPIKVFLRLKGVTVTSFIDDFSILAITKALAALHTSWTKRVLIWLGFKINLEKSSESPRQSLEYLGVLLNLKTLTISLPKNKVALILSLCQDTLVKRSVSRRDLEGLVGLLNFAHPMLPLGRMHLYPLISWMNQFTVPSERDSLTPVTADLRVALQPFLNRKFLETPVSFRPLVPTLEVMTDASDFGWSGVLFPFQVKDCWTPSDLSHSINVREMRAVLNSVSFCKESLRGQVLKLRTDNMATLFCLKKMGSLRCPLLNELSRDFLLLCTQENISFVPVHIQGCLNVLADRGSRKGPIPTEYCLDPDSLDWIFQRFRFYPSETTDFFATRATTRCASFVSPCPDPKAIFQDAMVLDWNLISPAYMFPPPGLMPQIIHKIESYEGEGILIAPMNRSAPWLPKLINRARHFQPLPENYFLFQVQDQEIFIQRNRFWNLYVWLL